MLIDFNPYTEMHFSKYLYFFFDLDNSGQSENCIFNNEIVFLEWLF